MWRTRVHQTRSIPTPPHCQGLATCHELRRRLVVCMDFLQIGLKSTQVLSCGSNTSLERWLWSALVTPVHWTVIDRVPHAEHSVRLPDLSKRVFQAVKLLNESTQWACDWETLRGMTTNLAVPKSHRSRSLKSSNSRRTQPDNRTHDCFTYTSKFTSVYRTHHPPEWDVRVAFSILTWHVVSTLRSCVPSTPRSQFRSSVKLQCDDNDKNPCCGPPAGSLTHSC